ISTEPLAIISIHLQGVKDTGTPSLLVYNHLVQWLLGNLYHIDINFNLDSAKIFFLYLLQIFRCKCFLVFLITYSDPESGCLQVGPNNSASATVDEASNLYMFILLSDFLISFWVLSFDDTMLSFIACGSVINLSESRNTVKEFASSYGFYSLFDKILAFSQSDFQPAFTHKFFMDLALNYFVYGWKGLSQFLQEHQALGAHIDIIEFQAQRIFTYTWTHPGAWAMGHS
ncbi:hypothetical protein CPB84DRAFT_1667114, partial [Gymnopilus junonius]